MTSALADPALKAKLVGMGMEAAPLAGAAYGERIANEVRSFAPLVKDLAAE